MSNYTEHVANLSVPRSFDVRVWHGDQKFSQELCDFVLSLALVFNDFRDVALAQMLWNDILPKDLATPTRELGQAGGLHVHLARTMAGILHELWELIAKSASALQHPEFAKIVRSLHPQARDAWRALTADKHGPKSKNPVARLVYFARNKVSFHYDRKAIAHGYTLAFSSSTSPRVPYISDGSSMAATRFYFGLGRECG